MNNVPKPGKTRRAGDSVYSYLAFNGILSAFLLAAIRLLELLIGLKDIADVYRGPAFLEILFTVLMIAALAGTAAVCLFRKDTVLPGEFPPCDTPLLFSSLLAGFLMLAYLYFRTKIDSSLGASAAANQLARLPSLLTMIFAPLSAAYFLLHLFWTKPPRKLAGFLSFFPVLFCAAFLISIYFDSGCALNNPIRVMTQVSLCFTLFFFAEESRMLVSKPLPRLTFMAGTMMILTGTASALPIITLSFILHQPMNLYSLYGALQIGFIAYAVTRLNTLLRAPAAPADTAADEEKAETAEGKEP